MKLQVRRVSGEVKELEVEPTITAQQLLTLVAEIFDLPPGRRKVILGDVAFISGTLQEAMQDVNLDHLDHLEATVVEVSSILGVLATTSGKAIIWDVDSNALLCQLKVNDESQMVWYATFNPNGTLVATASEVGDARIFEVETGQLLHLLPGHSEAKYHKKTKTTKTQRYSVQHLSFSPNGRLLATASATFAMIWEVASGTQIQKFDVTARCLHVAFSPDNSQLATAAGRGMLWDVTSGEVITLDTERVQEMHFSSDHRHVLTLSPFAVMVWSRSGERQFDVTKASDDGFSLKKSIFCKDDLLVIDELGTVDVFNLEGQLMKTLPGFNTERSATQCAAVFEAAPRVAVVNKQGGVVLWDLETSQKVDLPRAWDLNTSNENGISFSADGTKLAVTDSDCLSVNVFDVTGNLLSTFQLNEDDYIQAMQLM